MSTRTTSERDDARTHSIEADYLNGEIVLLARLHGVPAPINEFVRRVANEFVRDGRPPNSMSDTDLRAAFENIL
jgi:2-dehydropantoate 2-reductase